MKLLQFLFGQDFKNRYIAFKPGTFYLDTASNELWIDDPSSSEQSHAKIIDTDTLIFNSDDENGTVYPEEDKSTTARLGHAHLSRMKLGTDL